MSRRKSPRVVHRRAGRAAGALTVVALTAFGPSGPGFAAPQVRVVGTVVQDFSTVTPAAAELAGPVDGSVPGSVQSPNTVTDTPTTAATTSGSTSAVTTTGAATTSAVPPSAPTGSGIPGALLAAYKNAESALAASNPGCHLPWTLVAGIGRVESGHASGGRVDDTGTTRGRILGPRLDGSTGGTAVIRDSDGGALDGDTTFDRAVGPMQFIPGTWKGFAKDGNGDGVASPHNVFDAAVAAGSYLCAGGGDLSQPAAQRAALLRYNRSDAYGALVLRWAAAYGAGVSVLPNAAGEVPTTTPTPPAQVPAPAAGTLDPSTSAALAAPAPTVTGSVASESSADADPTTVTTTTTTSSTTPTTTTPTTSTTTTTPVTTTTTSSTTPTTTSSSSTTPTTSSTTTPTSTTSKPVTTTRTTTTTPTTTSRTTTSTTTSEPDDTETEETTSEESTTEESTTEESTTEEADETTSAKTSAKITTSTSSDDD